MDKPAIQALVEATGAIRMELRTRDWFRIDHGFGVDPYADLKDAEFHLRALYRILGAPEQPDD